MAVMQPADRSNEWLSQFEFLEDEDVVGMPAQRFTSLAHAAPLPPPPVYPSSIWEAMDAEYRLPPEPLTRLPLTDLLQRNAAPAAVLQRSRLELPFLLAWLIASCLLQGPVTWVGGGLFMIAFSCAMRPTFALAGLEGHAGVYRALGAGQVLAGVALVTTLGAFMPVFGLYCLGVLFSWIFVECRYLYRLEKRQMGIAWTGPF